MTRFTVHPQRLKEVVDAAENVLARAAVAVSLNYYDRKCPVRLHTSRCALMTASATKSGALPHDLLTTVMEPVARHAADFTFPGRIYFETGIAPYPVCALQWSKIEHALRCGRDPPQIIANATSAPCDPNETADLHRADQGDRPRREALKRVSCRPRIWPHKASASAGGAAAWWQQTWFGNNLSPFWSRSAQSARLD